MLFENGRLFFAVASIVLLGGCSSDSETPFDHLVPVDASAAGSSATIASTEAVALIEDLGYQTARDSLESNLLAGATISVSVYEIQSDESLHLQDSTIHTVNDESDFVWLRQLLPDQQTFAAARSQEMFRYTFLAADSSGVASVNAEVIPGSDVPGGLHSITLRYETNPTVLAAVNVVRDGGGLFFTERSSMHMTFRSGIFDSLDNIVILTLPFRDPVAYRTIASTVGNNL